MHATVAAQGRSLVVHGASQKLLQQHPATVGHMRSDTHTHSLHTFAVCQVTMSVKGPAMQPVRDQLADVPMPETMIMPEPPS